jgi:hypothetical protein
MVTPFGVSHCTSFQGYACWSVSHLKLLKEFHIIFAHYVRIQPMQNIKKQTISFHFVKWEIGIYL